MRIVIGAAAGNIGRRVAEQVLDSGADAVLLVRNPASLPPHLANHPRADVRTVDMADPAAGAQAAHGADALFWLVPPNAGAPDWRQWYHAVSAAGTAALRQNRIPRAVLVSSLGAGMAPGLSTVTYAGEAEQAFNATGASVACLRPGYFMENLLLQAEAIRATGLVRFPFAAGHDFPFVSVDDIGDVAARYLLSPDWAGQWARNLMGPANLTLPACAAIVAAEWGHPVRYLRQSDAEFQQQLAQWGLAPAAQAEMAALFQALGDPNGPYATPRTPEAASPTTFAEFAHRKLLPLLQRAG